jgi:hypothetical protein
MLADAEALRNLRNRIAPLRDLAPGVALKLFAEIRSARDALPASKLGKKASTNLGAIQASSPNGSVAAMQHEPSETEIFQGFFTL